jgi:hypothetical protein
MFHAAISAIAIGMIVVSSWLIASQIKRGGPFTPPPADGEGEVQKPLGRKGASLPVLLRPTLTSRDQLVPYILLLIGLSLAAMESTINIGVDKTGHIIRVFGGSSLGAGQIIAREGQKGPQAKVLGPGFHFWPFFRAFYTIEEFPILTVQQGSYVVLTALDGAPLREGQFMADEWPEAEFQHMLDAEYFLGHDRVDDEGDVHPRGQRGPQLTVIKPGSYRINSYLFKVKEHKAEQVLTGEVAVVRSSVQTVPDEVCKHASQKTKPGSDISTPIVPKGCVGVWDTAVMPGNYYFNSDAYDITHVPTRATPVWYRGGFVKRRIDLEVQADGSIKQALATETIDVPEEAVDSAIMVRVEGWTLPVEFRLTVQVSPENAPIVVATLGTLANVEKNILTPIVRDELRTIGGQVAQKCRSDAEGHAVCEIPPTHVLDFVEKREEISERVRRAIIAPAGRAGVTIVEARLGDVAIPPELMVATLRKQLAEQLQSTYDQEKQAQTKRIEVERQRATAEQQNDLVKAEIAEQAADHYKNQREKQGAAEKAYLNQVAEGQEKQAKVLGEDRVLQLKIAELTLQAAKDNPDIVKVPQVLVQGAGGIEGAAAVLGASNLVNQMAPKKSSAKQ